jgi:hypothetical protein
MGSEEDDLAVVNTEEAIATEDQEASLVPEVLPTGEAQATVAAGDEEAHEDPMAGTASDGHAATDRGDHLAGTALVTTPATDQTLVPVGFQAGSRFPTTLASRSRFHSPMVPGATLPPDQMFLSAMTTSTVQASSTIQVAMIRADIMIRIMSGTTTRPASTTSTTPRDAATLMVSTTRMVSGNTTIRARKIREGLLTIEYRNGCRRMLMWMIVVGLHRNLWSV